MKKSAKNIKYDYKQIGVESCETYEYKNHLTVL